MNQKGFAKTVPVLVIVLLVGAVGYLALVKLPNTENIFISQKECEQKTGKSCSFQMCDDIPPGKTVTEVCGKHFRKGWVAGSAVNSIVGNATTSLQTITPVPPEPNGGYSSWQSHSNTEIGFSFKYPQTWKVDDGLKINTCCLHVFNSVNPYQGDFLKQGVMKAQFQYHADTSISNKQQYIDSLIKGNGESEMGTPISKSSVISMQNENGLDILKFNSGAGNVGYVIPRKQNFSEVIYVIVWNPDSTFEKVLSTLTLTN